MPQMAPIGWLTLFFVFSIMLVIFNIKNCFCFLMTQMNYPKIFMLNNTK